MSDSTDVQIGHCRYRPGCTELLDNAGQIVRLRAKTRQVLATLVASAGEVVSYQQLFDAVWGDTIVTQDSLVQCVAEIRQAIGDEQHRIVCTEVKRGYRLVADPWPAPEPTAELESAAAVSLNLRTSDTGSDIARFFATVVMHQIGKNVSEMTGLKIHAAEPSQAVIARGRSALILSSQAVVDTGKCHLILQLTNAASDELLWTDRFVTSGNLEKALSASATGSIAQHGTENVIRQLARIGADSRGEWQNPAPAALARAIADVFSYQPQQMSRADTLLTSIDPASQSTTVQAWKLFLYLLQHHEFPSLEGRQSLELRIRQLTANLSTQAADSPLALSVVAQALAAIDNDPQPALMLAKRAYALDESAPLAHGALSTLYRLLDSPKEALRYADSGLRLTSRSINRHWWLSLASIAHLSQGSLQQSLEHAVASHALSPTFKPPLRHIYPLALKLNRQDLAQITLSRMRVFEPDFSMQMLRDKPNYPAFQLRQSGLTDLADVSISPDCH